MCQPSLAMGLPAVARTSPSRAFTGLRHANFFRVTFETRSSSVGHPAVDEGSSQTVYPSPNTCDGYAPHDLLPRTVEEVRLAVLPNLFTAGKGGEGHPLFSTLDEYLYLKCAVKHNWLTLSTTYIFPDFECFDPVSVYACFAFQAGGVPRPAERGFLRLLDSMGVAPSKTVPWRSATVALLLSATLPMKIRVLAFLVNLETVDATIACPHCKDTIMPAHVATACPLMTELTKNTDIFTAKKLGSSPTVAYSMTHELAMQFTRPVVDAIVGLACAPVQGVQIDFNDPTYAQANAVVKAAVYGHCSFSEASAILAERLDAAADELAVGKIRGAMESLKSAGESAVNSATGTLLFIWSKVSNVIAKRLDFTYKLEASGKLKSAVHSVTLVRPETEAEFYEMSHLFIMTIVALGLATAPIVMKFIDDVVFATVRMKEPFRVAHELLICYFREIDFDPARVLNMANVFRRGGQDTLLSEARRNAAAFFRTCGANPQLKGAVDDKTKNPKPDSKPNGKSDDSSKKPCADFNAGRPCKKLKPDGTCVFAHRCNQFVSDKGLGGYCFGAHARCTGCDYDATKKLRAPAA